MILTDTALFSLVVIICILEYLQLTFTRQDDVMQKISQPDALLVDLPQFNMGLLGKRRMADLQLRIHHKPQGLQDASGNPFDSDFLRWRPGSENREPLTIFVTSRKEGQRSGGDIPWARIQDSRRAFENPGVSRVSNERERTRVEQTNRNRNQCGRSAAGVERSDRSQQAKNEETEAKSHSSSNRKFAESKDPGSKP